MLTKVPASQSVQLVQDVALEAMLNVPPKQFAQVWSAVALPFVSIAWPGLQVVQLTHAVVELPSASQVPLPQSTFAAVPPAQ